VIRLRRSGPRPGSRLAPARTVQVRQFAPKVTGWAPSRRRRSAWALTLVLYGCGVKAPPRPPVEGPAPVGPSAAAPLPTPVGPPASAAPTPASP
jgi:hypothetical protein